MNSFWKYIGNFQYNLTQGEILEIGHTFRIFSSNIDTALLTSYVIFGYFQI